MVGIFSLVLKATSDVLFLRFGMLDSRNILYLNYFLRSEETVNIKDLKRQKF